jgi:TonB family protein
MPDHHNKKRFLNMPKYPGGSEAFRKFIAANLRYPEAAIAARIEGTVIVEYDIFDNGEVQHPRVIKGIGHGCDEEAVRVISLLRFEKVKNRGVRLKMTTKANINFKLPEFRINYSQADDSNSSKTEPEPIKSTPVVYEYTVKF